MTNTISIEEANPFKGEEPAVYSSSDIKRIQTNVEFKSDNGIIVALPDGETTLLRDTHNDDFSLFDSGDKISIFLDPDNNASCDNIKYSKLYAMLPQIKSGKIFTGKVIDTKNQGLIVDINGLETFMPQAQIDYKVNKELDMYIGSEIDVKFIRIKLKSHDKNRFLPIVSHLVILDEQNSSNAQKHLSKLHIGDIISGTVKNFANYGVFVTLFPTVDGLIHIKDLSWKRINNPSDLLSIGQVIDVMILEIKELKDGTQRICLGLKQTTQKPWDSFDRNSKVGDIVKGSVFNIMDYGIFIMLPCGVQGLVHKTELSWDNTIIPKDYIKGQEVKAKIINIDWEKEKLLLSIKQLDVDPWTTIDEHYAIGDKVKTQISSFTNFGIFVSLDHKLEGLIHVSELSWLGSIKKPKEHYKIGDDIDAVILNIDKDKKRIELSYKRLFPNPWESLSIGQSVDVIVDHVNENGIYGYLLKNHLPTFLQKKSMPDTLMCQEKQVLHCIIKKIQEKANRLIVAFE